MARQNKIAHRYAKATFDYLGTPKKVREMVDSLGRFAALIGSHEELSRVLYSEVFAESQREPVVEDLVKKMKLGEEARRVLLVLTRSGRLNQLAAVVEQLRVLLLQAEGVIPLDVVSAVALEAKERKSLEEEFSDLLGKKVEATYLVEPSLLGGLRVKAGGKSYVGTLSGWLEAFQERLVGG